MKNRQENVLHLLGASRERFGGGKHTSYLYIYAYLLCIFIYALLGFLSLNFSPSVALSLFFSFSHFLSISPSLSVFLSLSLHLFLSVYFTASLFLPVSLIVSLCSSLSLSISLSLSCCFQFEVVISLTRSLSVMYF